MENIKINSCICGKKQHNLMLTIFKPLCNCDIAYVGHFGCNVKIEFNLNGNDTSSYDAFKLATKAWNSVMDNVCSV